MRRVSFWSRIVLLAMLLCTLAGPRAGSADPMTGPAVQTWAPPINVSNNPTRAATKPSLGIDGSGTLHLVWVDGTPPATKILYAAKPVGQPWSGTVPIGEQGRSDNPRLFVDNQNQVHVVWQGDGNANKANIYYRQIRSGLPTPLQQITNIANETTFPDIAVDNTGLIHIVFLSDASGVNNVFYIAKRFADPNPAPIAVGSSVSLPALLPQIAVDSQGTAHVVWAQPPVAGQQNNIFYAYRPASQVMFSPQPPMNASNTTANSTAPKLAIDNGDNLHLIWLQNVGNVNAVFYSRKGKDEFLWRSPINASATPANNTQTPALALDTQRNVHVVYAVDVGGGNTNINYVVKAEGATTFSIPQPVFTSTTPSTFPTVVVQNGTAVHVAWQQAPAPEQIFYSAYQLPQPAPPTVILQQIEADSPTIQDNLSYQWVQLYNNGPTDVVLDNWQICSNAGCSTIPRVGGQSVILRALTTTVGVAPANQVIIVANADRFRFEHPNFAGLLVPVGGFLANGMNPGQDTIQLRSPQGGVVDQVSWGAGGVVPPPPKTRDTLQRNLQSNSWFVAPENPVSNAQLGQGGGPQNALFVPIALKSYQNWDTGVQVQNLGTQPATVYATYYNQQGIIVTSEPVAMLAVGASKTYFLPSQQLLPGNFFGSMVLTATQAIAGIVNLTNYQFVGAKSATSSYNAVGTGSTSVALPFVKREANFTTQFVVQNTTGGPTSYRVSYYDQQGLAVGTFDGQLAAWGSQLVDVANTLQRTGFVSAVVTSPTPVAVAVLGLNTVESTAITYRGAGTATNTVYAPLLFKNRNGYNSTIAVQNVGTQAAQVTISYQTDTGVPLANANETVTIQPNGFYRSELGQRIGLPDNWVGSATVTSQGGQAIAVVVDQVNPILNQATSYNAIDFADANVTLYAPLLMKANNGWDTGLQVQNVGATPATVTITYYTRDTFTPVGTPVTQTIQPGAPFTFFTPDNAGLPPGWVGSAVIQSTTGSRLVGVVNQVNYKIGNGGDTSMTFSLVAPPSQ